MPETERKCIRKLSFFFKTCAPKISAGVKGGAERRVKCVQTQEQRPPLAPVESIYYKLAKLACGLNQIPTAILGETKTKTKTI